MATNKIYSILRIESQLSPWWGNRWEFDKQNSKPTMKTKDTYDQEVSLTADELVFLTYLYFTKREILGVSVTSIYEVAHMFGYKASAVNTRTSRIIQAIIDGAVKKCAPENNRSITIETQKAGTIGWEKTMYFRVQSTSLKTLRAQRDGNLCYLQLNNQEFSKILYASQNSNAPFAKLLKVYMYIKTFFAGVKIQDGIYGWGGWRNSNLASLDLHMSRKRFSELRNVLVEHQVLYRNKQNPSLLATIDDPVIWEDIFKRWPCRPTKKGLYSLSSDGIGEINNVVLNEDEPMLGNMDIEVNIEVNEDTYLTAEMMQKQTSNIDLAALSNKIVSKNFVI